VSDESTALKQVIEAPADKIIEALTDFETFPEWQAAVIECEVLERDDDGRGSLVRMKVDAKVRKVEYVVRYAYDLPNSLAWEQVSGDLKENIGKYTFAPRDDDGRGSLVRMKVDAKVRKVEYVVRYAYDLPNSLAWEQVSGDLKENIGKYTFAPRDDGSTEVTVDIVAEVGFFVPGPMKKLIREQSLKNSLRELKKRVSA
jgi:uncharacterized membrane protein